jgi:methionyl-tRNA formyltransferase
MRAILLGNDTMHRRYIINQLIDAGININACVFQENILNPNFELRPNWAAKEEETLRKLFLENGSLDISRVKQVLYVKNWNDLSHQLQMEINLADFIIVSGAGWIKGSFLKAIKDKSLNVHLGIAEEYRGLDTNLWAWYHSDYENIGITIHQLDYTLDTGGIYFSERLPVSTNMRLWNLRYFETITAVNLIKKAYKLHKNGNLVSRSQTKIGRYYSHMPAVIKNNLKHNILDQQGF